MAEFCRKFWHRARFLEKNTEVKTASYKILEERGIHIQANNKIQNHF